jgi:hypothetical protein
VRFALLIIRRGACHVGAELSVRRVDGEVPGCHGESTFDPCEGWKKEPVEQKAGL